MNDKAGRETGAEDERVDEEADERLDLGALAIRERGADDNVGLSGVPAEKRLVPGKQRHEERDPLVLAESGKPLRQLRREPERERAAVCRLNRRPGPVGGEVEAGGAAGKLLFPVGELTVERRDVPGGFLHPAPLPERIIGVLDGQVGQKGGNRRERARRAFAAAKAS